MPMGAADMILHIRFTFATFCILLYLKQVSACIVKCPQVCGLSVTYCCYGDGPLSAVIPTRWPPMVTSPAPSSILNSPAVAPPAEAPGSVIATANNTSPASLNETPPAPGQNGSAPAPGQNGSAPAPALPVGVPAAAPAPAALNATDALFPAGQLSNQTAQQGNDSTASTEAAGPVPAATQMPNQTTHVNSSAPSPAVSPTATANGTDASTSGAANQTAQPPTPTAVVPTNATLPSAANSSAAPSPTPTVTPASNPTATPLAKPVATAMPASSQTAPASLANLTLPSGNTSQSPSQAEIAAARALAPLLPSPPGAAPNSPEPTSTAASVNSPGVQSPALASTPSSPVAISPAISPQPGNLTASGSTKSDSHATGVIAGTVGKTFTTLSTHTVYCYWSCDQIGRKRLPVLSYAIYMAD